MLLRNTAARLITINGAFSNGVRVEEYQIKPGNNPAVEVPDNLCDSDFVRALIADGSLQVIAQVTSEYDTMAKADLIALCESRGIETNSRDTVKILAAKLEA